MTLIVRTNNEYQDDKIAHFIGRMYYGSINNSGNFNPEDYNYLVIGHANFREATLEEIDWFNKGAKAIPKYQVGDTVKVVYIPNSDSKLLYGVSMTQIGRVNKITNIRFKNGGDSIDAGEYYVYEVDDWEVAGDNLELVSQHPVTLDKAYKPFDKNNFLVSFNSMDNIGEYFKVVSGKGIKTNSHWKGFPDHYYGVEKGIAVCWERAFIKDTKINIYTITEIKKFLNILIPKPFDKDNFLIPFTSIRSMREYTDLCDEYDIPYGKGWEGLNEYHYGVINGINMTRIHFKSEKDNSNIPVYTFNEFKQLLTNKIETNEIQRTNIKDSGRIINRGEGFSSRRQPSSIEGRLEGNKQSYYFRKKKAYISEIKGKIINKRTIRLL